MSALSIHLYKENENMLDKLPQEIIKRIFSFLLPSDLRGLSLVSKTIKILAEDDQLWNRLIAQDFANKFNSNITYKNIYHCFFKHNDKKRKLMEANPIGYAISHALKPKQIRKVLLEEELEEKQKKTRNSMS